MPGHRPALGPCWVWTGCRNGDGYGKIAEGAPGNGWHLTNRVAFFLANGRWPEPQALHACDTPSCVKAVADAEGPAHIFEGTQQDNARDMAAKGRQGLQRRPELAPRGERHGQAKLVGPVVAWVYLVANRGMTQRRIASLLGVSPAAICHLLKRHQAKGLSR